MSIDDPTKTAKKPADPDPLESLLTLMTRIDARVERLAEQIDAIERRLDGPSGSVRRTLTRSDAELNAALQPPLAPTIAVADDGRLMLSVAYLEGADLSGRERWEGVFLTEVEEHDARSRISNDAAGLGSCIAGPLVHGLRTGRAAPPAPDRG